MRIEGLVWLIVLVMAGVGTMLKFHTSHERMPVGCDEFGYLDLAERLDRGEAFDRQHGNFMLPLLDTLRNSRITENEISWMVTPHAYHVIPGTSKIINQYPPATSWLLSWLPRESRKIFFPFIIMLSFIVVYVVYRKYFPAKQATFFSFLFPVFLFLLTVSTPFVTELSRVNSLAPTFALLISAGMVMRKNTILACMLIAISANFRIANILMVLPVILFLQGRPSLKMRRGFYIALAILLAVLPVIIYTWRITGSPSQPTYSTIDSSVASFKTMAENFTFYFSFTQHWWILHLILLVMLVVLLRLKKLSPSEFSKWLIFPAVNYVFFIIHAVTMDYYPYASAMILAGGVLGILAGITVPKAKITGTGSIVIPIAIAVIILVAGYSRYRRRDHITYTEARLEFAALCPYDVVWADLYSGTSEYVCANNGFRFSTSTPRARKTTMRFLHRNRVSQAFVTGDILVSKEIILDEIQQAGLKPVIVQSSLGELIVIN